VDSEFATDCSMVSNSPTGSSGSIARTTARTCRVSASGSPSARMAIRVRQRECCAIGRYTRYFGGSPRFWCRISPASPTTVAQRFLLVRPPSRMRWPTAPPPGQYLSAIVRSMITTGEAESRSASVKGRPSSSGVPMAAKYPGDTAHTLVTGIGSVGPGSLPSMANSCWLSPWLKGTLSAIATARVPGIPWSDPSSRSWNACTLGSS
jgi:hypothetical protein